MGQVSIVLPAMRLDSITAVALISLLTRHMASPRVLPLRVRVQVRIGLGLGFGVRVMVPVRVRVRVRIRVRVRVSVQSLNAFRIRCVLPF